MTTWSRILVRGAWARARRGTPHRSSIDMAEAQIAALTAQVEKEKNTAKENLQKAIKASREKKVVETELQQVKAQLLQAQQAAGALLPTPPRGGGRGDKNKEKKNVTSICWNPR